MSQVLINALIVHFEVLELDLPGLPTCRELGTQSVLDLIDSSSVSVRSTYEMMTAGLNLLISDKADVERDAVARAFESCGGTVHRIGRFWDPPTFEVSTVRVYGAVVFCLVLQQKLGLTLCSPPDELLLGVPSQFLNRRVTRQTLGEISSVDFPAFIKPVAPKLFSGAVYETREALVAECRGLPVETAVFVSEPVTLAAEVRTFVLQGEVLDAALYEGKSELSGAVDFMRALTKSMALPRTIVIDVGLVDGRGWVLVEFNPSWGAGLNGCDAGKVLPAIVSATGPN